MSSDSDHKIKGNTLINLNLLDSAFTQYRAHPFDHCVIDNFLTDPYSIENEFLNYDSPNWIVYENFVQNKKVNCDWFLFPKNTYRLFTYLNSQEFVDILSNYIGCKLYSDPGLQAGGWHIHGNGGLLNPHLDYSTHPKLPLERKLNLIIYVSSDITNEHGGHLGLWAGEETPKELVKEIAPIFNRAVIFDTTQNSWHGLSQKCTLPAGVYRKSLAVYYLTNPKENLDPRSRVLFSLTSDQLSMTEEIENCPHLLVNQHTTNHKYGE